MDNKSDPGANAGIFVSLNKTFVYEIIFLTLLCDIICVAIKNGSVQQNVTLV